MAAQSVGLNQLLGDGDFHRPNVLFVSVDDWNDWARPSSPHSQLKTPHVDKLRSEGLFFQNAHCPAPICNPSRTATLLGKYPHSTGVYNNGQWWRPALPQAVTLPRYFREQGYFVAGGGKIFHHTPGFNDPTAYDDFFFWDLKAIERGWSEDFHYPGWPGVTSKPVSEVPSFTKGNFDYVPIDVRDEDTPDGRVASWGADFLQRGHNRPFFLCLGMFRPHLEWYTPEKYFDLHPLESIGRPPYKEGDLDDLGQIAKNWALGGGSNHSEIMKRGLWLKLIQAYLASVSFADAQVGRILNALRKGPNSRDTIVVFWSDHGYHLGEKDHWHKTTLWERSTRIPLIIKVPGLTQAGSVCRSPVNLVDLYPTMIELCGLPEKRDLDGLSLRTLLERPDSSWQRPAITSHGFHNCAVRSERWRYILYADGNEELYDHARDPHEWHNVAYNSQYSQIVSEHKGWLPASWEQPVPIKSDYEFNPLKYTWSLLRNSR